MGKRSGVPHRAEELAALTNEELQSELERSRATEHRTFRQNGEGVAQTNPLA